MKFDLEKNISNHVPVKHGGLESIEGPKKGIIDFSSNVNPLGCTTLVKKIIKKSVNAISVYPDPNSSELRNHLEWYTGIPKQQIVVGNGATEIIYNFCKAFFHKKKQILLQIPTFGEYEAASKLCDTRISFFKSMNLNNQISEFIKRIPKRGCIFICNPNNPTGSLISKENMMKIITAAKNKSTLVFVDECFIELVPDHDESVKDYVKKFDNLFVLRSLTKSFGLAGIRIGYGLASKMIINVMQKIMMPWNVSGLAQKAAGAALCHKFHLDKTRKLIKKESKFIRNSLSKMDNFSCYNSYTNFVLIKSKINSKRLQKKLLEKKILVRDCSNFRGLDNKFIRVAVRTHTENVKLVKALEVI